jgi:hypothetical protein
MKKECNKNEIEEIDGMQEHMNKQDGKQFMNNFILNINNLF